MKFSPETVFEDLGPDFADAVAPAAFPKHILRYRNDRHAVAVGLDGLSQDQWISHFGKFEALPGAQSAPLAVRYHGHQFRQYNPQIGDGRGFLFAQMRDCDGRLLDFGTKGSGQTPYSRSGDGRLTLKGGVREVLATEMLEALGVYTSKSFSLIETGEQLHRGDEPSPTRSSVLVRLSHSHVRYGAFQRFAYFKEADAMARLVDYSVRQFFPELEVEEGDAKVAGFLKATARRGGRLAATWMAAGFTHGVLNTDNLNVTGESFDYGPYRFIPHADPGFTAAYFDQTGLYAYGRQGEAVGWALSQLGGALVLIAGEEALTDALQVYPQSYREGMADAFFARLGLKRSDDAAQDLAFVSDLLEWMGAIDAPFEQFFFDWFCGAQSAARAENSPVAALYTDPDFQSLKARILAAEPDRPQRLLQPFFEQDKPITLLIDEIEALWARIAEDDDWSAFETKLEDIASARSAYQLTPRP